MSMVSVGNLRLLQKGTQQTAEESGKELKALQEAIRAGTSTGDHITDFVILNYSGAEEVEEKIKALDDNLRKNKGGLVALEEFYSYSWREAGCFGGGFAQYPSQILVGRIQEPYLELDESKDDLVRRMLSKGLADGGIPVNPLLTIRGEAHVRSKKTSFLLREEPTLELRKTIPIVLLAYLRKTQQELTGLEQMGQLIAQDRIRVILGEDTQHLGGFHGEKATAKVHAYRLHVGTDAVDACFNHLSLVWMGQLRNEPKTEDFYAQQRKLLLDDTTCQEYFAERERRVQATRILKTDSEVMELLQKTYLYEEKRTSAENEPENIELQKSAQFFERSVKELLGKAVQQGLHQEQRELTPAYLPGVRINVAELVTGLCAQYKIEIKK